MPMRKFASALGEPSSMDQIREALARDRDPPTDGG